MKTLKECCKTTYVITFKISAKDHVCTGKHYYPTKEQHNLKDYENVIMDDIAETMIANYKKANKIAGNIVPGSLKIELKFES